MIVFVILIHYELFIVVVVVVCHFRHMTRYCKMVKEGIGSFFFSKYNVPAAAMNHHEARPSHYKDVHLQEKNKKVAHDYASTTPPDLFINPGSSPWCCCIIYYVCRLFSEVAGRLLLCAQLYPGGHAARWPL